MASHGERIDAAERERFKSIPGHWPYMIDEDGRVLGPRGRLLKPSVHGEGYYFYALGAKGKRVVRSLAHLLCITFLGPKPSPDHVAVHLKGAGACGRDDVRWGTRSEAKAMAKERRDGEAGA